MTSRGEPRRYPGSLRDAGADDGNAILELNEANVVQTAPLTPAHLDALLAMAFRARVHARGEQVDGFLIALDERAESDSPNFAWFRERYARFVYIDRIIVSAAVRGRGLGRALYQDLLRAAEEARQPLVCAEVNVDPPNPGSDAFHASMGFAEVGRAILPGGQKTVRYLTRRLPREYRTCHQGNQRE